MMVWQAHQNATAQTIEFRGPSPAFEITNFMIGLSHLGAILKSQRPGKARMNNFDWPLTESACMPEGHQRFSVVIQPGQLSTLISLLHRGWEDKKRHTCHISSEGKHSDLTSWS